MQDLGLHTVNLLFASYLKVIHIFPIFQSTSALTKPLNVVPLKKKSLADIYFMCHRLLNEKQLITQLQNDSHPLLILLVVLCVGFISSLLPLITYFSPAVILSAESHVSLETVLFSLIYFINHHFLLLKSFYLYILLV